MYRDTVWVTAKQAHVEHQTTAPVICLHRFEKGFTPVFTDTPLDELNGRLLPQDVAESAISATIFGWDVPISREAHNWLASDERPVDEAERPTRAKGERYYLLVMDDGSVQETLEFNSERERLVRLCGMDDEDDHLIIDVDRDGAIEVEAAPTGEDAKEELLDLD